MAGQSRRVAFAASREFPELDESWPLLRRALLDADLEPFQATWEDQNTPWEQFALVLVNYVWGYVTQRAAFLTWAESVSAQTRVVNPLPLLRWNSDKRYLADLAGEGVPIVPTTWIPPGAPWEPPAPDYVIKPTVGSGAIGAARYARSSVDTANEHVQRLHASGLTVMVQPYQSRVDEAGETGLLYFDGQFSHAIEKQALLHADVGEIERLWEQEAIAPTNARPDQSAVAKAVLAAVARCVTKPTYARIDLIDDAEGRPQVLEVELIEPSLYLPGDGRAATHLARILHRLVDADVQP